MQLALPLIGAGIGGAIGGTFMGMSAAGIGWTIGSIASSMLGIGQQKISLPDQQGPRLADKSVQGSAYGSFIPITYGSIRLAGNVIWAPPLIEVRNVERIRSSGGGKGGGGSSSSSHITYSYFANCAILLCEGEIDGVARIWADGKLVYDRRPNNTGFTGVSAGIRVYKGDFNQQPDPLLQSYLGANNTPAYRGRAYIVFERLDVAPYGNRIPNFTFEVVRGPESYPPRETFPDGYAMYKRPINGRIYTAHATSVNGPGFLVARDVYTGQEIDRVALRSDDTDPRTVTHVYGYQVDEMTGEVDYYDEIWVAGRNAGVNWPDDMIVEKYDPNSLAYLGNSNLGWSGGLAASGATIYNPVTMTAWAFCGAAFGDARITSMEGNFLEFITSEMQTQLDSFDYIEVTPGFRYQGTEMVLGGDVSTWRLVLAGQNLGGQYIIEIFSYETNNRVHHISMPAGSGNMRLAWDTRRDVVYVARDLSPNVYELDPIAGTLTLVLTAPANVFYMIYSSLSDSLWLGSSNTFRKYDVTDWSLEESYTTPAPDDTSVALTLYDNGNIEWAWLLGGLSYNGELVRVPLLPRIQPTSALLMDIVTDISERAGLEAPEIDVADMTEEVLGYVITKQAPARAALEPLLLAYFYDAVESD